MVERVYTEEVEERPRDTVVVERDGSRNNAAWVVLAVVIILLLIFFLVGNPFGGDGADVNVDVPTPTVNTPAPTQ